MFNRLSIVARRSIGRSLNCNCTQYGQIIRPISITASKFSTVSVGNGGHLKSDKKYTIESNLKMGQQYSTDASHIKIPVVSFEEVKDLPNHPEKTLIDVREPSELQETGIIPTAINIPRKYSCVFLRL